MPTTVLEKTIYVAAFAAAIALAALTASLPLNLRSHQASMDAPNGGQGNGDMAWTIVATILGFFLSPALAHFYATVHGHDTADTLKYTLVAGSLISFLWVVFTYSLAYGKDAHKNGIYGLPLTYYMFHDTFNMAGPLSDVYGSIYAVYELGFALVAATIVISSVASRVNLNGLLAFMFVWHILIYCPMAHIAWANGGAFESSGRYQDFSGALPVHVLGGITAIVLHLVLGKDTIPKSGPVQNTEKALFGSFVVFFLWFGFNAGKAHAADSVACQSIVNTIAAAMTSVLTGFFYNLIMEKPTNSLSLAQSIIIGLIAITSGSGYVTVGGAMCISICTYLFTVIIAQFILGEGANLNEPFGVATLHATAGSIGFLWTAIISYKFINPSHMTYGGEVNGALNGLTAGYGMPLAYHISFLLATWACCFIAVFLIAFIVNMIVPIGNGAIPGDYKAPEAAGEEVNKEVQLTQV